MKLFYSKGSPYACKVRMVAKAKNITLDLEEVVVAEKNARMAGGEPAW